jgi:Domain of unknown function (DUF4397)
MRVLKIVFLLLVLAATGVFMMSCGSGGDAQVRVVNGIDNSSNLSLDVYINGGKEFSNVGTDGVTPPPATPAAYVSVPSGSDTIQAYDTGTTSNPLFGNGVTTTLGGSTQYTLLLVGPVTAPTTYLLTDNNTVPKPGYMNVRVINAASTNAANGGIGVSIYESGQTVPPATNVPLGQSTGYVSIPYVSGETYFIEVFLANTQIELFTDSFVPGGTNNAGQITTFVITDNGNAGISEAPIKMVDLN